MEAGEGGWKEEMMHGRGRGCMEGRACMEGGGCMDEGEDGRERGCMEGQMVRVRERGCIDCREGQLKGYGVHRTWGGGEGAWEGERVHIL